MRFQSTLTLIFWMYLFLIAPAPGGDLPRQARECGVLATAHAAMSGKANDGTHITANGTLRILVVFASFPDDEKVHPYWPAHQPPLFMDQFIDPDTTVHSQSPLNLTNYFNQMSLGKFHLIGEAIWVQSWHSQTEYANGSYGRANWSVLQESVDPIVDFSRYDNWTNQSNYLNTNAPDSIVDMIIMVWRTTVFDYVGEASLGYKTGFVVDGKRIEMGFPERPDFPRGSGVTCEFPYSDTPQRLLRTMVHEFGHWLLGGPHPYNSATLDGKHQYWGILCAGQRVSSCANSYERERLGWVSVPDVLPNSDIVLPDYVTTGVSHRYHPPSGDPLEYLYLENHQRQSVFDDVTGNPDDRGLWILHQEGPYIESDNLRIMASDGNWSWSNPGTTTACFSAGLPIFTRGDPGVLTGLSHRDQIPNGSSAVNWMLVFEDPPGPPNCGSFFAGEMFNGAFSLANPVFSPYSNPGSATWNHQPTSFSLEVVDDRSGVLTVRSHGNPLDGSPARRFLGADPTISTQQMNHLSLAWGSQWTGGQPLEADVNWSELQRKVGGGGTWDTVYQGPAIAWEDAVLRYDSSGTLPIVYRVRVRDADGKFSAWSNLFSTRVTGITGLEVPKARFAPDNFELGPNYPNPFNPATVIGYQLPVASNVRLVVYDILGREVATLVDEKKQAGRYEVRFDGTKLNSGIYFYRMTAGNTVLTRKMVLAK